MLCVLYCGPLLSGLSLLGGRFFIAMISPCSCWTTSRSCFSDGSPSALFDCCSLPMAATRASSLSVARVWMAHHWFWAMSAASVWRLMVARYSAQVFGWRTHIFSTSVGFSPALGLFVVDWFVCGIWLLFVWVVGVVDLMCRVGVGWVGLCWVVVVFGGVVLLKLASSLAVGSSFSVSDSDVTSVS